jgi:predicted ribosome quality control (RQC) complex YloA/Tae2 family protein
VKIKLFVEKDAKENADFYYSEGKRYRDKAAKAEEAIKDIDKRIKALEKVKVQKIETRKKGQEKAKEWFENYRWFRTEKGRICIAGKNADENEEIVKKYMEEKDLFFHADIHGGAVILIKDGINADIKEKISCAIFAASYSSAWELGYNEVGVFAARKGQLSKTVNEGNLKKGGFGIEGEREWYKHTVLGLVIGRRGGKISSAPWNCSDFEKYVEIRPGGNLNKAQATKKICEILKAGDEEVSWLIPKGKYTLRVKK